MGEWSRGWQGISQFITHVWLCFCHCFSFCPCFGFCLSFSFFLSLVIEWWESSWQGMSPEIAQVGALFHLEKIIPHPPLGWMQACFKFIAPPCISMHYCISPACTAPTFTCWHALQNMVTLHFSAGIWRSTVHQHLVQMPALKCCKTLLPCTSHQCH